GGGGRPAAAGRARRFRQAVRGRNREVGEGGQVVGRESGLNACPLALFLLLRTDRLPAWAGRLLRELPRPLEEERRGRVIVRAKREFLGRGGKIARTIAGEPRLIGLRAGQKLRRGLARHAERLENAHRLSAALDADRVELAPDERPAGQRHRRLRSDDGRG